MDTALVQWTSMAGWVARTSAEGSIIALAILLVHTLGRKRLPAQWRYAMWWILLIRLMLPWTPESPVSLFNALPDVPVRVASVEMGPATPPPMHTAVLPAPPSPAGNTLSVEKAAIEPLPAAQSPGEAIPAMTWTNLAGMLWLAGAILFLFLVGLQTGRFWLRVRRDPVITNSKIGILLEECKSRMGVRMPIALIASSVVHTPALFGFVRPRLLIPNAMLAQADIEALRYILLHELAHLRRQDILMNWLAAWVQVVHWFNPVLWYALHRMRNDREPACDAFVLSRMDEDDGARYGHALIQVFEQARPTPRIPAMAGIVEAESNLKRRLTMIAHFRKPSVAASAIAALLALILVPVFLTSAKAEDKPAAPPVASGGLAAPPAASGVLKSSNPAELRAACQNNLKQLGLCFKMFANESRGSIYPRLNTQPGTLMFQPEELWNKYLSDPKIMCCPALGLAPNDPMACIGDTSFWYLGFAAPTESEGLAWVESYRAAATAGKTFDKDFEMPQDRIPQGKIFRLREGIERFFITDINDPSASAKQQSQIPLLIERPGHHEPNGGNVLYMDGHVEFLKYPGKYPMTEAFIKALDGLDALKDLPQVPAAPVSAGGVAVGGGRAGIGGMGGMVVGGYGGGGGGGFGFGGAVGNVPGIPQGGVFAARPKPAAFSNEIRIGNGLSEEEMAQAKELTEKLKQPCSLEFESVQISELLQVLSDQYDMNFVLDSRAVAPSGQPPADLTTIVTDGKVDKVHFNDIPLGEALKAVLRTLNLDFEVQPHHIFISSPELLDAQKPKTQVIP